MGGLSAASQIISYELAMGISLIALLFMVTA
jgi:NADH:ubiquinone oxidoreductase subunit H